MTSQRSPFVFVVGCPRSGTTLLQRMLDNHPHLAVANDTHFIPRALHKAAPQRVAHATAGGTVPLDAELVEALVGYRRFHRIGVSEEEAHRLATRSDHYAEWIRRIYDRFAEVNHKSLGGEKTPDYVRHLPLLHGLFPDAQLLHIVRDGRDVALSTLSWAAPGKGPGRWSLWQRDPVGVSALWWRFQLESGRRGAQSIPQRRYSEVRYERLVAQPEDELRRISDFLKLPYDPSMAEFHRGRTTADAGKSAKGNWLPPTRGLRDWRTQMREEDLAVFEAISGEALESAGYELGASRSSSPSVRRRARLCLEWWDSFVQQREKKRRRRLEATP